MNERNAQYRSSKFVTKEKHIRAKYTCDILLDVHSTEKQNNLTLQLKRSNNISAKQLWQRVINVHEIAVHDHRSKTISVSQYLRVSVLTPFIRYRSCIFHSWIFYSPFSAPPTPCVARSMDFPLCLLQYLSAQHAFPPSTHSLSPPLFPPFSPDLKLICLTDPTHHALLSSRGISFMDQHSDGLDLPS